MSECENELVVLKSENFEEVVTFLDKHFFTREPLVSISSHKSRRNCLFIE